MTDSVGHDMRHILLAPCSRRKRGAARAGLRARDLPRGRMEMVAEEWARRLRRARVDILAADYYIGRGPAEAKAAASESGASLIFISAGLGLAAALESVPRYSLTTAAGDPDSVGQRVEGAFSPTAWWGALRGARGGAANELREICGSAGGVLVVALPGTYLRMIEAELTALPPELLARTRIVGAPREAVTPSLLRFWMPYDERLDGAGAPNPGTRGDFAQRAARHFFQTVVRENPNSDATAHADAVQHSLNALPYPPRPSRHAGSDDELIGVIASLLTRTGARSGQTLALLRREAGWACEQGRFRRLFALAIAERAQS